VMQLPTLPAGLEPWRVEPGMQPFRVTARLASAIVMPSTSLVLDGLLFAALCGDLAGRHDCEIDWPEAPFETLLPLAAWRTAAARSERELPTVDLCDPEGRLWGWCASNVDAEWLLDDTVYVRRPTPLAEFARWDSSSAKVDVGAKRYKAMNKALPSRLAESVWWHGFGHADVVADLLTRRIHHLGKLRSHGRGRVLSWTLESVDVDTSVIAAGRPARNLPSLPGAFGGDVSVGRVALRPPYWHRSRETMGTRPDYRGTAC
jgi:hypothetical protein